MTIVVPIHSSTSPIASTSKCNHIISDDGDEVLRDVVKQLRRSKKIVIISGAGVSTAASIPDFRSADGLFKSGRNGIGARGKRHSVKDLFHVKALQSETLLPDHHTLINDLCSLAHVAEPTPFHSYVKQLDIEGRLLRCYTQNIDGLEGKAGLAVGLPARQEKMKRSSSKKGKERMEPIEVDESIDPTLDDLENQSQLPPSPNGKSGTQTPAPRCIPLHGLLTDLVCPRCSASFPISLHLPLPPHPLSCPSCHLSSSIRHALSERSRGVGALRASIVLYGEDHPRGEDIGAVVERDLKGTGKKGEREGRLDLLLVAGTSLAIPGVKRMVKEMARSLQSRKMPGQGGSGDNDGRDRKKTIRTIFLNAEAPPKTTEWDEIFDVWIQSDIQYFVINYLVNSSYDVTTPPRTPRKPKVKAGIDQYPPTPSSMSSTLLKKAKRGLRDSSDFTTPSPMKKHRVDGPCLLIPPTPGSNPSSPITSPSTFMSRVDFEGSLTPLSDVSDDKKTVKDQKGDINPFLI